MRTIDKSKVANIKCEHCNWWFREAPNGDSEWWCHNKNSCKYKEEVNYWNRCPEFEWNPKLNYKEF